MAYNANNEERNELAVVAKNDRGDKVVVAKITNKNNGSTSLDIRNFYTDDAGELKPTQKGIRVKDELCYELVESCLDMLDVVELENLKEHIENLLDASDNDETDDEIEEE